MAYAQVLELNYKDYLNLHSNRLEVWTEGYDGDVLERDAIPDPVTIEWGDSTESEGFSVLYGSSLTFDFFQNEKNEFKQYFLTANSQKNLVKLYKDDILFWTGFLEPDTWEEDPFDICHEVALTAYDGIGWLSNKDFVDDNGDVYTGNKTNLEILDLILNDKSGLDLDIYHAINWVNNLGDNFVDLSKDLSVYEDSTCEDVLNDIFKGCRIFQRSGKWFVIAYSNFWQDQFNIIIPSSVVDDFKSGDWLAGDFLTRISGLYDWTLGDWLAGDFSAEEIDENSRILFPSKAADWFADTTDIDHTAALRYLSVNEDYGFIENIFDNGDFSDDFDGWSYVGITYEFRDYDDDTQFIYLKGGNEQPTNPYDISAYITQSFSGFETGTNQINLNFYYALLGASGNTSEMYIKIIFRATSGTNYYAEYAWDSNNEEIYLLWTETETALRLNRVDEETESYDDIDSANYKDITDNFKSFDYNIDGIPEEGSMQIYFYSAYTTNTAIAGPCYREIEMSFLDDSGDDLPTDQDIKIINDDDNNNIPDEIDLLCGDFPSDIDNVKKAYAGGFFNETSGEITTDWYLKEDDPATTYSLNELRGRLIASLQRSARQNYQATLADIVADVRMVVVDKYNDDVRLLENGIEYNDAMLTCEGQYTEILTPSISELTVENTLN